MPQINAVQDNRYVANMQISDLSTRITGAVPIKPPQRLRRTALKRLAEHITGHRRGMISIQTKALTPLPWRHAFCLEHRRCRRRAQEVDECLAGGSFFGIGRDRTFEQELTLQFTREGADNVDARRREDV